MIQTVFLDLDDTILDFQKAETEALKKALIRFQIEPNAEVIARYSDINRAQWAALERGELTREQVKYRRFALLLREFNLKQDAEALRQEYETLLGIGHYFLPYARELLVALHAKYRLFLASNGTSAVQNGRIRSAGIAPFFERIFLSEEVGFVKPQKEFFQNCFAKIPHFDPDRSIMIGDSLTSDIQGGINAGIRTCWFDVRQTGNATEIRPDITVTSLQQIPAILETL